MLYLIIILANLVVGCLMGIAGIAGFLLPIVYMSLALMQPADALALSFCSFLSCGVFGTFAYYKSRVFSPKESLPIAVMCLIGSVIGIFISGLIDVKTAKIILYVTVLLTGLFLLRKAEPVNDTEIVTHGRLTPLCIPIGILCALTGASGPILLVPLFTVSGMPSRKAVATGIFCSIFISIPAAIGYMMRSSLGNLPALIGISCIFQICGVLLGVQLSSKISHKVLRLAIAFFSVCIAVFMLIRL